MMNHDTYQNFPHNPDLILLGGQVSFELLAAVRQIDGVIDIRQSLKHQVNQFIRETTEARLGHFAESIYKEEV